MSESGTPKIADAAIPAGPRPPGVWSAWLTIAWVVGAVVLLFLAQFVVVIIFIAGAFVPPEEILANPMKLETNPTLISLAQFVTTPALVAYFVIAARASRLPVAEYLALKWPRLKHWLVGLAAVAAAVVVSDLVSIAAGHELTSPFMDEVFASARDPLTMTMLAISVVVLAPLLEEISFRGFIFPGFARDWGAPLAIGITSIMWALLHVQYDWFFIAHLFVMGLLLGWLRWWSGSTILVIVLHAAVNVAAIGEAYLLQRST